MKYKHFCQYCHCFFKRTSEEHTPTRELRRMQSARQALEPALRLIWEAGLRTVGLWRVRGLSFHAGVGWAWLTAQLILPREAHSTWMQPSSVTVPQAQNTCKHKNVLGFWLLFFFNIKNMVKGVEIGFRWRSACSLPFTSSLMFSNTNVCDSVWQQYAM